MARTWHFGTRDAYCTFRSGLTSRESGRTHPPRRICANGQLLRYRFHREERWRRCEWASMHTRSQRAVAEATPAGRELTTTAALSTTRGFTLVAGHEAPLDEVMPR